MALSGFAWMDLHESKVGSLMCDIINQVIIYIKGRNLSMGGHDSYVRSRGT